MRHQKNERLMEDIKLQEVAINAMRRVINDEDKCNLAIKRELEKGPARVRVKSREELKMDIQKYKSISIKIIQDYKRMGQKVPAYANGLAKQIDQKLFHRTNFHGNSQRSIRARAVLNNMDMRM